MLSWAGPQTYCWGVAILQKSHVGVLGRPAHTQGTPGCLASTPPLTPNEVSIQNPCDWHEGDPDIQP